MHRGASLVDRAQAALDAWVHAMSRWNDAMPPSSLMSSDRDPWRRHSEAVDELYRRWRELANEVALQAERRRGTPVAEEPPGS